MKVSLIAAMTPGNHVIGLNNELPWCLKSDMMRFRLLTLGKPIIMGRKTHESIGKPLPGRDNIVITRQEEYKSEGCRVVNSVEQAFNVALATGAPEAVVIGGEEVYRQTIDKATELHVTFVNGPYSGDAFFPPIGREWTMVDCEAHLSDDRNECAHSFVTYRRCS